MYEITPHGFTCTIPGWAIGDLDVLNRGQHESCGVTPASVLRKLHLTQLMGARLGYKQLLWDHEDLSHLTRATKTLRLTRTEAGRPRGLEPHDRELVLDYRRLSMNRSSFVNRYALTDKVANVQQYVVEVCNVLVDVAQRKTIPFAETVKRSIPLPPPQEPPQRVSLRPGNPSTSSVYRTDFLVVPQDVDTSNFMDTSVHLDFADRAVASAAVAGHIGSLGKVAARHSTKFLANNFKRVEIEFVSPARCLDSLITEVWEETNEDNNYIIIFCRMMIDNRLVTLLRYMFDGEDKEYRFDGADKENSKL